ncbi:MAG: rod-binding protein [Alphaproteobacteria bacterium]
MTPLAPSISANLTPAQMGKMERAAKDYESYFLQQVLSLMEPEGVSENPLFGGGFAEEMFRNTMHEETAKSIVKAGGIGLADRLYKQMAEMQARANVNQQPRLSIKE